MIVGYCEDSKGCRLVKLSNKKLCKAHDVVFFETKFAACQQLNKKANGDSHSEEEKMISDSRPLSYHITSAIIPVTITSVVR